MLLLNRIKKKCSIGDKEPKHQFSQLSVHFTHKQSSQRQSAVIKVCFHYLEQSYNEASICMKVVNPDKTI